jgi:site-specific recombinase XerD
VPTAIRQRVQTHGRFIFGTHDKEDIRVITDVWRRKLNRLSELCGPWAARPVHHRCRHTFARILLQSGVEVQDVAELLGDTEAITSSQ